MLGLLLWVDYFTTYSLTWKFSEFLVPPIIGLLGYQNFRLLKKRKNDKQHRLFYRLASGPSILGGAVGLLVFIPPMLFMTLLLGSNISHEQHVQKEISPNESKIAKVYLDNLKLTQTWHVLFASVNDGCLSLKKKYLRKLLAWLLGVIATKVVISNGAMMVQFLSWRLEWR